MHTRQPTRCCLDLDWWSWFVVYCSLICRLICLGWWKVLFCYPLKVCTFCYGDGITFPEEYVFIQVAVWILYKIIAEYVICINKKPLHWFISRSRIFPRSSFSSYIQHQGSTGTSTAKISICTLGTANWQSMHDLSHNFGDQNVPGSKWEAPDAKSLISK